MLRFIVLFLPILLILNVVFATTAEAKMKRRYPILPPNFDKISQGNAQTICDRVLSGEGTPGYITLVNDIKKYYGDPREFFYKYGMSLPCHYPSISFADFLFKKGMLNMAFSNVFSRFDRLDPNTFIKIKREGLIFEGPLHVVYSHLYKNFKGSKDWSREYRGVTKRLTVPKFVNGTPKSCKELQKEEPYMPCILPMPKPKPKPKK